MADPGIVYLVGAGPGDPGLVTAKGLRLLQEAEVLVYDRLVSPRLVAEAPAGAETVYAGKGPHGHAMEQEEINALLVERARQGKRVVRLKGGDPFLFGRGGEEADALAAAGLTFEIVPGVTSALAVPAYAGIPVTDRRFASSLRIITGRQGQGGSEDAPVGQRETVVALMGVQALPEVVAKLLSEGFLPSAPVALIERGTTARQRTIRTTLAEAVSAAEAAGLQPPTIAVVGGVVDLRERIAWFEGKPLAGRRVLMLRARSSAAELAAALEDRGAEAVLVPAVAFDPPRDPSQLDQALANLSDYRWVAFTSANGVEFFLRRLWETGGDARSLAHTRIATVGSATAAVLARHGFRADLVPDRFNAEALSEALGDRVHRGERVLLPRGDLADDLLPRRLEEAGVDAYPVVAYRTIAPPDLAREAHEALSAGVDIVVFTSPSTITNLVAALGEERHLLDHVTIACIGAVTARAARDAGLTVAVEAQDQTSTGIVDALVAWGKATNERTPTPRE